MRKKPYTAKGLCRVPCFRCGNPSTQQRRICTLDKWVGVCAECGIGLNEVELMFMLGRNYKKILDNYRKRSQ